MALRLRNPAVFLCVSAVLIATAGACTGTTSAPARAGATPSADQRGVSPDLDGRIQDFLDLGHSGGFDHIRAILVSVDDRMVFERYYRSSGATTGNVFSVTKSVMSTLIGIAMGEGHLRSVDQTLAQLLPTHAATMSAPLRSVTLRQILTMTAGLPKDPPDLPSFTTTDDWVTAILQDGTDQPAGESFAYSSAGSHLLSAILTEATGRSTLDYARAKLFTPLGIDTVPTVDPIVREENRAAYDRARFAWPTDPQGIHAGFSFLKLSGRDMEKLGRLWLHEGSWNGRQLVPAAWVAESTHPHVQTNGTPERYGYQFWVTTADDHTAYAAIGFGGQLIEVVPDLGLVVVVASADEAGAASSEAYLDLVAEYVAPAVGQ